MSTHMFLLRNKRTITWTPLLIWIYGLIFEPSYIEPSYNEPSYNEPSYKEAVPVYEILLVQRYLIVCIFIYQNYIVIKCFAHERHDSLCISVWQNIPLQIKRLWSQSSARSYLKLSKT